MSEEIKPECGTCNYWNEGLVDVPGRGQCMKPKGRGEITKAFEDCEAWRNITNDVVTIRVKCIGCKQEMEDLFFTDEEPDTQPVCGRCAETMEA
jgi:hypothetical protein